MDNPYEKHAILCAKRLENVQDFICNKGKPIVNRFVLGLGPELTEQGRVSDSWRHVLMRDKHAFTTAFAERLWDRYIKPNLMHTV